MVPLVDVYIAIQHSGDCKQCLLGRRTSNIRVHGQSTSLRNPRQASAHATCYQCQYNTASDQCNVRPLLYNMNNL